MKIGEWFKDKKNWLKTFNKPPEITIKHYEMIAKDTSSIECRGRSILNLVGTTMRVEDALDVYIGESENKN